MAVNIWNAGGPGNWNAAGNWSLGHVPQAGEDVVFDNTSVQNCTLDVSTADLGDFTIADNYTGTFTIPALKYIYATGDYYFGTGVTVVCAANSGVFSKAAGAQTLTTNGNVLGSVTDALGSPGSIQLQDPLTCASLLWGTIPVDQNGQNIVTTTTFGVTSAGSVLDAAVQTGAAMVTLNAVADWSAATLSFTGSVNLTVTGAVTIGRLQLAAGQTYAWNGSAVNVLTITNYVAGDWDGATITDFFAFAFAFIVAPVGMVVSNMTVSDCTNSGAAIDATDGTNTDGGGNTGWNFTAPVPPTPGSSVARQKSSTSVGIGIGVGI